MSQTADVIELKENQVWKHKHTEREYQITKVNDTIFGPESVHLVSLNSYFETGLDVHDLYEKFEFVREAKPLKERAHV